MNWPRCDICHKRVNCWHNMDAARAARSNPFIATSTAAQRQKWKLAKRKARAASKAAKVLGLVSAVRDSGIEMARRRVVAAAEIEQARLGPYVNEYARSIGEALSAGFKQGWSDARW